MSDDTSDDGKIVHVDFGDDLNRPMLKRKGGRRYQKCKHTHVIIDVAAGTMECDGCNAPVDPLWYITEIEMKEGRLSARLHALKREIKRSTACPIHEPAEEAPQPERRKMESGEILAFCGTMDAMGYDVIDRRPQRAIWDAAVKATEERIAKWVRKVGPNVMGQDADTMADEITAGEHWKDPTP